jgi:hypothetical protein
MYLLTNYYRLRLTKDIPDLSSERAPHKNKTSTFGQEAISGHKSQSGLETTIY